MLTAQKQCSVFQLFSVWPKRPSPQTSHCRNVSKVCSRDLTCPGRYSSKPFPPFPCFHILLPFLPDYDLRTLHLCIDDLLFQKNMPTIVHPGLCYCRFWSAGDANCSPPFFQPSN
ncbi:hypothetical protein VNO80_18700 [Phaseolus coccineus]|uniref:Uncharacterized protein n=1 Tax=Phaseolus coccineus TaxID=3886 RepID=A0AAN9MI71_PHACN